MGIYEVEELSRQIASECDAKLLDLHKARFLEASRSSRPEFSLDFPEQEKLHAKLIIAEARARISTLFAAQVSHAELCDLAAKYLLQAVEANRLAGARGRKVEADRGTIGRLREQLADSFRMKEHHRIKARNMPATVRREQASHAGYAKHKATRLARDYVKSEWANKREEYSSKSEFARHYVRLVTLNFVDGKGYPLKITEKTIKEVWLKDTPPAGKPAG